MVWPLTLITQPTPYASMCDSFFISTFANCHAFVSILNRFMMHRYTPTHDSLDVFVFFIYRY